MATRTFYRIVKTNPPLASHFLSFQAEGKLPPNNDPDILRRWDGISVYDSEEGARRTVRRRPYIGAYIAEYDLRGADRASLWKRSFTVAR